MTTNHQATVTAEDTATAHALVESIDRHHCNLGGPADWVAHDWFCEAIAQQLANVREAERAAVDILTGALDSLGRHCSCLVGRSRGKHDFQCASSVAARALAEYRERTGKP